MSDTVQAKPDHAPGEMNNRVASDHQKADTNSRTDASMPQGSPDETCLETCRLGNGHEAQLLGTDQTGDRPSSRGNVDSEQAHGK